MNAPGTVVMILLMALHAAAAAACARPAVPAQGAFSVLIYNVAGLPQWVSKSNPVKYMPLISPKLNAYDVVLVQEDFSHHSTLVREARHPFQSAPLNQLGSLVNDGLNRFSRYRFINFQRREWRDCHGLIIAANDCLSAKGFSVARHEIEPHAVIDIYNLHADAGGSSGDIATRVRQYAQLEQHIRMYSKKNALIVAGDTNLSAERRADMQLLARFMATNELNDVARFMGPGRPEKLDRVLFRNGQDVTLHPVGWRIAEEMVDSEGNGLSDHDAIHVDFDYDFGQ